MLVSDSTWKRLQHGAACSLTSMFVGAKSKATSSNEDDLAEVEIYGPRLIPRQIGCKISIDRPSRAAYRAVRPFQPSPERILPMDQPRHLPREKSEGEARISTGRSHFMP